MLLNSQKNVKKNEFKCDLFVFYSLNGIQISDFRDTNM